MSLLIGQLIYGQATNRLPCLTEDTGMIENLSKWFNSLTPNDKRIAAIFLRTASSYVGEEINNRGENRLNSTGNGLLRLSIGEFMVSVQGAYDKEAFTTKVTVVQLLETSGQESTNDAQ